jgi:hypothetical protein
MVYIGRHELGGPKVMASSVATPTQWHRGTGAQLHPCDGYTGAPSVRASYSGWPPKKGQRSVWNTVLHYILPVLLIRLVTATALFIAKTGCSLITTNHQPWDSRFTFSNIWKPQLPTLENRRLYTIIAILTSALFVRLGKR